MGMAAYQDMQYERERQRQAAEKEAKERASIQEYEARMKQAEVEAARIKNEADRQKNLMNDENAKRQIQMDQARAEREKDLAAGRARGIEQFKEGSMGRIDDETIQALRDQAKGFSNNEMNAMRDQNLSTINQANQGAVRAARIQQAANGVRGPQAAAQIMKMKTDQGAQIAANERELFLKNIDARRTGQQSYIDAQKYDQGQASKERLAQITTELGYGSLGSADRGAVLQSIIGEKQAAASAASGGGGGKK